MAVVNDVLLKNSHISINNFEMGTMGVEPMISSARGWQYTKLTYIPIEVQKLNSIIFLV